MPLALCLLSAPHTASLSWANPNDPDVAGYYLYFGTATGNYNIASGQDIGLRYAYAVHPRAAGTYYWRIAAYYPDKTLVTFSDEATVNVT